MERYAGVRTLGAIDWDSWMPQQRATLCFVERAARLLLIHKKRGIGAGKINGPGGRIDPGESALECAVREVREELCVVPTTEKSIIPYTGIRRAHLASRPNALTAKRAGLIALGPHGAQSSENPRSAISRLAASVFCQCSMPIACITAGIFMNWIFS